MSQAAPPLLPPLLRLTEMTKRFPGTLALDGVDLVVERGTIHGLIGENGAGKSTLLKILAGDYRPSSGRIEIEGDEVEVSTPRRAHELGIGIVYQELSLLANLSVAHNISLGNEPTNALAVDERRLTETAREVLGRMGVSSIDPGQKVGKIPLAERQLVEIAKVLTLRRPRILIFDEPTAALGQADVERLFRIMGGCATRASGSSSSATATARCCGSATARPCSATGRSSARSTRGDTSVEHLVELTLGQKAAAAFRREWRRGGAATRCSAPRSHVGARVRGVDLTVRRGEIVSVCGLLGSGQDRLARALAGDLPDVTGTFVVDGRDDDAAIAASGVRAGIALDHREPAGGGPLPGHVGALEHQHLVARTGAGRAVRCA